MRRVVIHLINNIHEKECGESCDSFQRLHARERECDQRGVSSDL